MYAGKSYDVPLSGWRRKAHKWMIWTFVPMIILGFGYVPVHNEHGEDEVDYSKYLGPDYRKNKFQGKRVSTIISNHIGFIEVLCWMSLMTPPAFTPAHFVQNYPIGDHYCRALQSLYVNRTSDQAALDKAVEEFIARQRKIENDELDWGPICIFAEGSVTNGKNLSRFRRGGF